MEGLVAIGFDTTRFFGLQARYRSGELSEANNRLRGPLYPPKDSELSFYEKSTSELVENAKSVGQEALKSGKVMSLILAGGMATRFGGVVKANVEVFDGRTFFDLKIADIANVARRFAAMPVAYFMTSDATHGSILEAIEKASSRVPQTAFRALKQGVSVRLGTNGEVFFENGSPSTYAPGHGDVVDLLADETRWPEGVEYCLLSNVDNLGATTDPVIVGLHILSKKPITAEIVRKEKGDKGGAPGTPHGQHLQIIEQFRFPSETNQDEFPYFNTNTFVFSRDAFKNAKPLTWFSVTKKVDGHDCIQFERLVGELTAQKETHFVVVPRDGANSRFLPVKDVPELDARRAAIRDVIATRGIV